MFFAFHGKNLELTLGWDDEEFRGFMARSYVCRRPCGVLVRLALALPDLGRESPSGLWLRHTHVVFVSPFTKK